MKATGRGRRLGWVCLTLAVVVATGCDVTDVQEPVLPGLAAIHGPWSANPIPVPAPIIAAADRACRGMMQPFPGDAQIVVIDARGKGVLHIAYAGPNGGMAQCNDMTVDAQGRVEAMGGGSMGQGGGPPQPVAPNTLEPGGSSGSGDPVRSSTTIGRAGPGIAAVRVLIPGQPPITASFSNGWYLVWWPGAWPQGTTVIGLDVNGERVAETTP